MRFFDLLKMAIANTKGKWAVLIATCMALCAFCLCYAGTVFMTVRQEKSLPFELVVTTQSASGITETVLAEIMKIKDVKDVTPVITIPVQMDIGEYAAQLTLTGVKPSYLGNNNLPENSVMPYIILNEAACKLFSKDNESPINHEAPKIDWLNAKTTVLLSEENIPVTSKVISVLPCEKGDEPTAYISLDAAKGLLRANEQPSVCTTTYVRIKNIGRTESTRRNLEFMGLNVASADEWLQTKWDLWSKEMIYLFVVGTFGLICSGALLFAWRSVDAAKQQAVYETLYWMGMKSTDITCLFALQAVMVLLIGVCAGILIRVALPSFLPQDLKDISIFILPITGNGVGG